MSNYITRSRLAAVIPPQFMLEALDDNNDGVEDAGLFDEVLGAAQTDVDGILGKRFAVPFANPIPAIVGDATLKLFAELLYTRRGFGSKEKPNPWAEKAEKARAALEKIAKGEEPLTPDLKRQKPSASVITAPAKTVSKTPGQSAI
jgi:phage gp36-like protein